MTRLPDELQILGCEPRISPARRDTLRRRTLGVGLAAAAAGLVWMAQVVTGADVDRHWPAAVVSAGVYLWAAGSLVRQPGRQWMAILGSAVGVTGGILYYQVLLGRWESWWYAWPLVVPLSVGAAVLGCVVAGWAAPEARRVGVRLMVAGAFLSVLCFLVVEVLVGSGDLGVRGRWPLLLPLAVTLAGTAVVAWPRDKEKGSA